MCFYYSVIVFRENCSCCSLQSQYPILYVSLETVVSMHKSCSGGHPRAFFTVCFFFKKFNRDLNMLMSFKSVSNVNFLFLINYLKMLIEGPYFTGIYSRPIGSQMRNVVEVSK